MILKYIVPDSSSCINVRQVLKSEFNMSNKLISKLRLNKFILLNSMETFLDKSVTCGDIITCNINFEEVSQNVIPTKMNLEIVYEDDCFLVINKPSDMAVHPSVLHYDNSLSNGIKYYFDCIGLKQKIRPVNRLDKDTTGLVIFAKNEYIQECLIRQMKDGIFYKEYFALLDGVLSKKKGTINSPIARKEGSIIERCIDSNGDNAVTIYELINTFNNVSEVKFVLKTGRTHQIRVHSKYIGHPILGDTLYGTSSKLINRQALHCHKLSFVHPITKSIMNFVAPIPLDMKLYKK